MKRLRYMISSRMEITPNSFWPRNVIWLYKYVSRNLHTVLLCSRLGLAWLAATRVAVDIFTSSCWSYMYIQCVTGLTLFQVMACCFLAPSHFPNTYWIIINRVQWKSSAAILEEPWITKISLIASCNPPILSRLFRRRSKKISKLSFTGLCEGNWPVTGEFPSQRASYAANVSIWWRNHDVIKAHEWWESSLYHFWSWIIWHNHVWHWLYISCTKIIGASWTHLGQITHIYINKLGQHCFR